MSANDRQVAGNHYEGKYQHWDLMCDLRANYVPAMASKYVSRWRKKNGVQDLEKAIHCLEKAQERELPFFTLRDTSEGLIHKFLSVNEFELNDKLALRMMFYDDYAGAIDIIKTLIEVFSPNPAEPTRKYVDQ